MLGEPANDAPRGYERDRPTRRWQSLEVVSTSVIVLRPTRFVSSNFPTSRRIAHKAC